VIRIGPIVCELEGPGPTLYISSTTVMTGPFDCLTTFKSGDMVEESNFGFPAAGFVASFAACAARASFVQTRPVITAAAPMTALRIMNVRRSMYEPGFDVSGNSGNNSVSLSSDGFMVWALGFGFLKFLIH
jgi:hypothetical protein